MNLDILSLEEAVEYVPRENSYQIRIFGSFNYSVFHPFIEHKNWIDVKTYSFDDAWPADFKEYSWVDVDDPYFSGVLIEPWNEISKMYPETTKESLLNYLESRGQPWDRYTLFNEDLARKMLNDFEDIKNKVENVMIHCIHGKNRSPAVGIAMNEIYDWGIVGLEKKFPEYRRYVFDVMMRASDSFK